MSEEKKSLVEEALLQMKNLEEAVTQNAKGILASTMKEEISELVKESLSEEEIEDEMVAMEEGSEMEKESEMAEQEMELDIDDEEDEMDMEMDMDSDEESEDEMEDEGEEFDMEDMLMMDLPGDDMEVDDEEEVLLPLDLTDASDEEILKVFKAMGEEDGIIVKQEGDEITLKDDEADVEYQIQMESKKDMDHDVDAVRDDLDQISKLAKDAGEDAGDMKEGEYSEMDMDEVVYEIEMDEEMEEGEYSEMDEEVKEGQGYDDKEDERLGMKHGKIAKKDLDSERARRDDAEFETRESEMSEEEMEEGEATEGMVRSHAAGQKASSDKSKGLPKPHSIPNRARYNESTEKELQQLREKNEEYRKALNIFKEKLNEVAVFNSNLAYATRLFTENTTTKQEKINILRRFDSVETLKESKTLYKTLKEEYSGMEATKLTESVSEKVSKTPTKGSSSNLIESKTYENPQFLRMKDLMSKVIK